MVTPIHNRIRMVIFDLHSFAWKTVSSIFLPWQWSAIWIIVRGWGFRPSFQGPMPPIWWDLPSPGKAVPMRFYPCAMCWRGELTPGHLPGRWFLWEPMPPVCRIPTMWPIRGESRCMEWRSMPTSLKHFWKEKPHCPYPISGTLWGLRRRFFCFMS